jgi:hypothetical protein
MTSERRSRGAGFATAGSHSRSGPRPPRPGDLIGLTRAASVQFAEDRAAMFRIISIDQRPTYAGWVWLVGYTLDKHGQAVERREVFVQTSGLVFIAADRTCPAPQVGACGVGLLRAMPPGSS